MVNCSSTDNSLAEKPLTQSKPTSLNLYFESVTAKIMFTTMSQLEKVLHVHLVNYPHYTILLDQISYQSPLHQRVSANANLSG